MLVLLADKSRKILRTAKNTVEKNLDDVIKSYLKKNLTIDLEDYKQGNYTFGITVTLRLKNEVISQKSLTTR